MRPPPGKSGTACQQDRDGPEQAEICKSAERSHLASIQDPADLLQGPPYGCSL